MRLILTTMQSAGAVEYHMPVTHVPHVHRDSAIVRIKQLSAIGPKPLYTINEFNAATANNKQTMRSTSYASVSAEAQVIHCQRQCAHTIHMHASYTQ